jgi:DNA (cytosine-5)-methyltransferase 1
MIAEREIKPNGWVSCFLKPTAVSLFSGAGGMDLGVSEAGFEVLASIERDPNCSETLRSWIAQTGARTQVLEKDIREVDPNALRVEIGMEREELDLLFGGPPCQAFSQIGKRLSLNDERGLLLFEMTRFAEAFRPRAILIEQVKGLLNAADESGHPGSVLAELLRRLDRLGYTTTFQVVNAADYGVPQLRQRVFFVCTRDGKRFDFPPATHGLEDVAPLLRLRPYVTVGDALVGLGRPSRRKEGSTPNHVDVTPEGDQSRIYGVPEGSHLAAQTHLPATQRGRLTKKDTTKYRRLARNEPAITLRCGEIFFHPSQDRYLTPREYLRLHGYPDSYTLKGPVRSRSGRVRDLDQHRQVANSVPPPIARLLASSIRELLFAPTPLS